MKLTQDQILSSLSSQLDTLRQLTTQAVTNAIVEQISEEQLDTLSKLYFSPQPNSPVLIVVPMEMETWQRQLDWVRQKLGIPYQKGRALLAALQDLYFEIEGYRDFAEKYDQGKHTSFRKFVCNRPYLAVNACPQPNSMLWILDEDEPFRRYRKYATLTESLALMLHTEICSTHNRIISGGSCYGNPSQVPVINIDQSSIELDVPYYSPEGKFNARDLGCGLLPTVNQRFRSNNEIGF